MNEVLVSFSGITIRYPDGRSYPNINLEVRQGEHLAIIGENEPLQNALLDAIAGKANIISGTTRHPFFAEYVSENHISDPLISPARLFAMVSARHTFRNLSNTNEFYYQQRFNSIDSENALTVEKYLLNIRSYNANPTWKRSETIELLRLGGLLDEELIKLSNGETKRVLLAAALLRNPVVLLLNNPFTGLDAQSRSEISSLTDTIAQSGITIVMTVTQQEIPPVIKDAIVVLNNNSIARKKVDGLPAAGALVAAASTIDQVELAALLAIRTMPEFRQIVHMQNVSIRYGEHLILDQVHWTILQGERWALLGHNGAGKSTLLSLINGDNPQAFANNIILFDRKKGSGESIWDIKRKIGFFSSELYQYFPVETSCLHAVESGFYDTVGLFRPSQPKTASIARRWMKLLEIDHLSNKILKHVPVVQQRLCLLARALVKSPVLLILDEPCQGFSDAQRDHFKNLVDQVCAISNITLIYVSHYQEEIPDCVTQTLKLERGRRVS